MLLRLFLLLILSTVVSSLLTYYRHDKDSEDEDRLLSPSLYSRHRRDNRMCGTVLLASLRKICGGCVKPAEGEPTASKRAEFWAPPAKRDSLVDNCCKNKCSMDYLKKFCC